MNAFFDIRTLSLFSGFISACLSVCMTYIYKRRMTYPGFGQWNLAFVIYFIGFVLLSLRNILPLFLTVIVSDTLIVLCYIFIARGLNSFANGSQKNWMDSATVIVSIIGFFWFTYISSDITARILILSFIIMMSCLRCSTIAVRKVSVHFAQKTLLLTIVFYSLALLLFLRIILTVSIEGQINDFMSDSVIQGFSIIVGSIGNIFIAIGLIITNAQRLENEIKDRTSELTGLYNVLKNSEAKFRALSDAAFEGIVISEKGTILEVNNAMVKMFGYASAVEFDINKEALSFIDPDRQENTENGIPSGCESSYESVGIKADGTRFPIEIHDRSFWYKGRQVKISAVRDITDHKKTEEAQLERERMQGVLEVAGTICHELNQPLMTINGYAELIALGLPKEAPLHEKVSKLRKQVSRMGNITRRLMNITRYETKAYIDGVIIDIEKASDNRGDT
jgi:PAS domain S-box-containing protein